MTAGSGKYRIKSLKPNLNAEKPIVASPIGKYFELPSLK